MSGYNTDDSTKLQALAGIANGSIESQSFVPGWGVPAEILPNIRGGMRAILFVRPLPSTGSDAVVTLAIGQSWRSLVGASLYIYDSDQNISGFRLAPIGRNLGSGECAGNPEFNAAYLEQYSTYFEPALFKAIEASARLKNQLNGKKLFITAQAQAAPLAQLAAMAFRRTRTGLPDGLVLSTECCYTFGTPPVGNAAFSTCLNANAPSGAYNVYAGKVDQFASPPVMPKDTVRTGTAEDLSKATIPVYDEPWFERSTPYYTQSLGGADLSSPSNGAVSNPPEGFSANFAFTLAELAAAAYGLAMRPDLPQHPVVPNYNLEGQPITSNNVPWAYLFTNKTTTPARVIVVFRGSITFTELAAAITPFGASPPGYLPKDCQILSSVDAIYSPLREALRSSVSTLLQLLPGQSKEIVVTGHDLGGTLANVCALDIAADPAGLIKPGPVYTFGAQLVGNISFAEAFNAQFALKSFQLGRPGDIFPSIPEILMPVKAAVQLTGVPTWDDPALHALRGYAELLNPSRFLSSENEADPACE
jgi:Lipase (class 3)